MTKVRINKYLSAFGICSRRKADEYISNGDITVNGARVTKGTMIDPSVDQIRLFGKEITKNQNIKLKYFAFYKPKGVITTLEDELGRKSISSYLKGHNDLKPVGRLDKDSEGLLILTNDGNAIYELTHPKFEHEKEYYVEANMSEKFDLKDLDRLVSGITIDKIRMKAEAISKVMIEKKKNLVKFNLVLHTGYNRQIRRTCDKIGLSVSKIERIRFGNLSLQSVKLKPGEMKEIKREQIL